MVWSGISNFPIFSLSYKSASVVLFNQLDGSATKANTLVYPIVFLNRHYIELQLKEIIIELNLIVYNTRKFSPTHDLMILWDEYINLLSRLGDNHKIDKLMLCNVKKLIKELNVVDCQSASFRYPVKKAGENKKYEASVNLDVINLTNFMVIMNKLYVFFDWQSDAVYSIRSSL